MIDLDPVNFHSAFTSAHHQVGHHSKNIDGDENAQHSARYRRKRPDPLAFLHPSTAARAGIADGDWFTIETALGAVRHRARCSDALAEDVVRADRWWYPERSGDAADPYGLWATNINVCTSDDRDDNDPVMGAWLLRGLPCRVRAIASPDPGCV